MIRNCDSGLKKPRQHLAPTVVRLQRLIAHGRIAEQINRRHFNRFDFDRADSRVRVVEFERQLLVPGPPLARLFAILEPDLTPTRNTGVRMLTVKLRVTNLPGAVSTLSHIRRRNSALIVVIVAVSVSPKVTVTL